MSMVLYLYCAAAVQFLDQKHVQFDKKRKVWDNEKRTMQLELERFNSTNIIKPYSLPQLTS